MTPSTPTVARSSLDTPRTPARVASGRKVGTASVPRRVARGSGIRGVLATEREDHDELIGYRCLRNTLHSWIEIAQQGVEPAAIGRFHSAGAAAERSRREADDRVTHREAPQEADGRRWILPVDNRNQLQQQRDIHRGQLDLAGEVARLCLVLLTDQG